MSIVYGKAVFIMAAMLMVSVPGISQRTKTTITWSEVAKESRAMSPRNMPFANSDGFSVVKCDGKGCYLEYVSSKMKRIAMQKLEYVGYYAGSFYLNDQLYILKSEFNKKAGYEELSFSPFSVSSCRPEGSFQSLMKLDFAGESKSVAKTGLDVIGYSLSPDRSKVLIYANLRQKKKDNEEFLVAVCDQNMNLIWDSRITLPYPDRLFRVNSFFVDNGGNIHLMGAKYFEEGVAKSKFKSGESPFENMIISFYNEGDNITEYVIEVDGMFLRDITAGMNQNGDIVCGGLYSDFGATSNVKGLFFLSLDPKAREIKAISSNEFGMDFLKEGLKKGEAKQAEKADNKNKGSKHLSYKLRDIIFKDDGGAMMVAEQTYVTVVTRTDSKGNTTYSYLYYFNDIIVANINPDGSIGGYYKIPKRQMSANDDGHFSSYAMQVFEDRVLFFFNDSPKNVAYRGTGAPEEWKRGQKSVVMMVEATSDGTEKRRALFSSADAGATLVAKNSRQVSQNSFIGFAEKGKSKLYFKIDFQ